MMDMNNFKMRFIDDVDGIYDNDETRELELLIMSFHKEITRIVDDVQAGKLCADINPGKLMVLILSNMALNLCNRFISKNAPIEIRLRMVADIGEEVRNTFVNSWEMLENFRARGGEGMACH